MICIHPVEKREHQCHLKSFGYIYDQAWNRASEKKEGDLIAGTYNDLNHLAGRRTGAGCQVRIQGTVDKDAKVTITEENGVGVTIQANQEKAGTFEALVSAAAGINTFKVMATSPQDSSKITTQQFAYDFSGLFAQVPAIPNTSPA